MLAVLGWLVLVGVAIATTGFIYIVSIYELNKSASGLKQFFGGFGLTFLIFFMWYGIYTACPFRS